MHIWILPSLGVIPMYWTLVSCPRLPRDKPLLICTAWVASLHSPTRCRHTSHALRRRMLKEIHVRPRPVTTTQQVILAIGCLMILSATGSSGTIVHHHTATSTRGDDEVHTSHRCTYPIPTFQTICIHTSVPSPILTRSQNHKTTPGAWHASCHHHGRHPSPHQAPCHHLTLLRNHNSQNRHHPLSLPWQRPAQTLHQPPQLHNARPPGKTPPTSLTHHLSQAHRVVSHHACGCGCSLPPLFTIPPLHSLGSHARSAMHDRRCSPAMGGRGGILPESLVDMDPVTRFDSAVRLMTKKP